MADTFATTLRDLGSAVGSGRLSSTRLVEEALARIDTHNGALNAVVALRADEALAEARAVDNYVRAGGRLGPLAGVPMLAKDNDDVTGMPTTKGSRLLRDSAPALSDGLTTARLRTAGAIVVGKTNVPEFAIEGFTANLLQGVTSNPWNLRLSPGGSSGGSAAALSAGLVPLATGTDGGGSVRIPAAFCGLVGFKPTNGVIGRSDIPEWIDFSTDGFMATCTDDLRLLLDIVAGPTPGDPSALVGPLPPARLPVRIIAAQRTAALGDLPQGVAGAFARAVDDLADLLGVPVTWKDSGSFFTGGNPDIDWFTLATAEHAASIGRSTIMERLSEMHLSTQSFLLDGLEVGIDEYLQARRRRFGFVRELDLLLADDTVLVTPTVAVEGLTADGRLSKGDPAGLLPAGVYSTALQNATGLPAVSLPAGFVPNGLPFGLQVTAPRWADRALLDIAQLWEAAHPWALTAPGYEPFGLKGT